MGVVLGGRRLPLASSACGVVCLRRRLPLASPAFGVAWSSLSRPLFGDHQATAQRFAKLSGMILLAGRYDGIDERREFLSHVLDEVVIDATAGAVVGVVPTSDFLPLFEIVAEGEDSQIEFVTWRPRPDSNRRPRP